MICRICNKMFKTDKTLIIHYKNIHSDLYNSLLDKNIRVLDYNNKLVLNTYLAKNDININENVITFNTNTPIFVHDNGGYNEDTIKIMEFFK